MAMSTGAWRQGQQGTIVHSTALRYAATQAFDLQHCIYCRRPSVTAQAPSLRTSAGWSRRCCEASDAPHYGACPASSADGRRTPPARHVGAAGAGSSASAVARLAPGRVGIGSVSQSSQRGRQPMDGDWGGMLVDQVFGGGCSALAIHELAAACSALQ